MDEMRQVAEAVPPLTAKARERVESGLRIVNTRERIDIADMQARVDAILAA
jgi:hypothetical protein